MLRTVAFCLAKWFAGNASDFAFWDVLLSRADRVAAMTLIAGVGRRNVDALRAFARRGGMSEELEKAAGICVTTVVTGTERPDLGYVVTTTCLPYVSQKVRAELEKRLTYLFRDPLEILPEISMDEGLELRQGNVYSAEATELARQRREEIQRQNAVRAAARQTIARLCFVSTDLVNEVGKIISSYAEQALEIPEFFVLRIADNDGGRGISSASR
jgi:hypothetical protein